MQNCCMRMQMIKHRLGKLIEWECCGNLWQLILYWKYPRRNTFVPTCPSCGARGVEGKIMIREGMYKWTWNGQDPGEGWELVLHSERDHGMRGKLWFKASVKEESLSKEALSDAPNCRRQVDDPRESKVSVQCQQEKSVPEAF